jgi:23S rRNA pseudoU1915 N3-methylase RlmH
MLKISLYFTQKTLTPSTTAGLAEYRKRLSKSCQLNWTTSIANETVAQHEPIKTQMIRLVHNGQTLTSPQLAQQIQRWTNQGKSHLVWIFGNPGDDQSSSGQLSKDQRSAAQQSVAIQSVDQPVDQQPEAPQPSSDDFNFSLSPLALSGDVAGLLTAEQIYRAFRILENQPYHK